MIREEINKAKTELQKEGENIIKNLNKRTYFSNVAFIIFDKITDYEEFYSWFPHTYLSLIWFKISKILSSCCRYKFNGGKDEKWFNSFKVERAPEPEDVIWENLYYSDSERLKRKFKTYFYSLLLSIVNLGIILGLNYAQVITFY